MTALKQVADGMSFPDEAAVQTKDRHLRKSLLGILQAATLDVVTDDELGPPCAHSAGASSLAASLLHELPGYEHSLDSMAKTAMSACQPPAIFKGFWGFIILGV